MASGRDIRVGAFGPKYFAILLNIAVFGTDVSPSRCPNTEPPQFWETAMKHVFPIAAVLAILALSGCANTIRGMGADTANTVNATQSAGHRVARSTY
jgi:entericidin B